MERSKRARVWGSLVVCAGIGASQDNTQAEPPLVPPELTAPSSEPQSSAEPAKTSETAKPVDRPAPLAAKPAESRPLLIIPGVTAPKIKNRTVPSRALQSAERPLGVFEPNDAAAESPRLESPASSSAAVQRSPAQARRNVTSTPNSGGRASASSSNLNIPLRLEPIPDGAEELAPPAARAPEFRERGDAPRSTRTPPATMTAPADSADAPERSQEEPSPRRNSPTGGVLGRFLDPSRMEVMRSAPRSEVKVERRSDPAADTALRRRVEHQIREQMGDRVSGTEVRVVGRNILIRTHATRFWQKRGIRKSLETLPGLAAYQTRVELVD